MPVVTFRTVTPQINSPISPSLTKKWTKIVTGISAIVIGISMVSFGIFTAVSNNENFQKSHGIETPDLLLKQSSGTEKSDAAQPGNGTAVGVGGTSGENAPVITLTATPDSVELGQSSTLKWSVTNDPTACEASEDWSGGKAVLGEEQSPALTQNQVYFFTLTCKNATGTGYSTVSVGVKEKVVNNPPGAPNVTIVASPTSIYAGDSSTIIWESTENATACTASGNWSGIKAPSGAESTGKLTSPGSYTYTLNCTNGTTSSPVTTRVEVKSPPADVPLVLLSSNPVSPVSPGTTVTLSWTVTNSATSCSASGDWSGGKSVGGGSANVGALSSIKTYTFFIECANSAGSTNDTASVLVIPSPPAVSLAATPSSLFAGNSSTLSWSATNSPTSCTASGDWSGAKAASGSQSTGSLGTIKTYYYSLACTNAGGTGFQNNVPVTVTLPPPPVVSISANPIATTVGNSSTLSWSATNSPTSCTASGDWSGAKSTSGGTQGTGALNTIKTYSYSLTCSNAGGSNSASTSVSVSSGGGGSSPPVVTIAASPGTIGAGSSSTISWSATNSPTSCTASGSWSGSKSGSGSQSTGAINVAGTYTYTLSCSNSAGADTKSAILTANAVPVVSISVSPNPITAGSSSTLSWSATNSPTSCTASGSWSGSKSVTGGSQSTGVVSSVGTYTYTLSCTNSGGTGSNSTNLTVNAAPTVYCGGSTPCYGVSDLASHSSAGNCWAWNSGTSAWPWVINITSFRPSHKGGAKAGTLEESTAVCNHNINTILSGGASIPGYKDSSNATTHNHASATKNNSGSSQLSSYRVGYYDPAKP